MKIGFVLDDTLDTPDGVQQYILTLGRWMTTQGHEVHYIVGQTTRTDLAYVHAVSRNMKVKFNGNRMSMPLPASRRAIGELLAREKYDVLHVQMPYSPFMAHRVLLSAPRGTVLVGTFHIAPHSDLVHYAARVLALWTRKSLRKFDKIYSVSPAAAEFAHSTYKIDSEILPNVVDIARFATAQPFAQYADKPTIVFLGRLVPRKGCQVLLDAVVRLRSLQPGLEYRLIVCGRGPLEAELKQFAAQHDITDDVEFTGFVSEADKARYLKSANVAVFPSSGGESFGIVLIEAMAGGNAVVLAADNPGYASVLAPYPDVLFPVNDSISLASKMHVFLTDQHERRRALDWQAGYVPRFDTAVVGRKLLSSYAGLCGVVKNKTGSSSTSVR